MGSARPARRASGGLIAGVVITCVVGVGAIVAVALIVLSVKAHIADPQPPTSYPYPSGSAGAYPTDDASSTPTEAPSRQPTEETSGASASAASAYPTEEPTQSPAGPATSSEPSEAGPSSQAASAPQPTHSAKPEPRPDLRKQHGYETVPLPPNADSLGEAAKITADDTIYEQRVSERRCSDGPPLDYYPNPSVSDHDMRAWLQRMADCDEEFWSRPVAQAGFQATKVIVNLYDGPTTNSPCGTGSESFAAFYCSANQELYVGRSLGNDSADRTYDWGQYWEVVSHEYGHHIQARTGIFESAAILENSSSSTGQADKVSRRIELQAQCFSGLAITRVAGMSGQRYAEQVRFEKSRVDTDTHGSGAHQSAWFNQGHQYRDIYECDTFKVPPSAVS